MNRLPDDFTVYPKGHEPKGHHPSDLKHIANLEQLLRDAQRKNDAYEVVIAGGVAAVVMVLGLCLFL